jgi:hypothetical protein
VVGARGAPLRGWQPCPGEFWIASYWWLWLTSRLLRIFSKAGAPYLLPLVRVPAVQGLFSREPRLAAHILQVLAMRLFSSRSVHQRFEFNRN